MSYRRQISIPLSGRYRQVSLYWIYNLKKNHRRLAKCSETPSAYIMCNWYRWHIAHILRYTYACLLRGVFQIWFNISTSDVMKWKFCTTGPLWEESIDNWSFPFTKCQQCEALLFFEVNLSKLLSKHSSCRCFETPSSQCEITAVQRGSSMVSNTVSITNTKRKSPMHYPSLNKFISFVRMLARGGGY